MSKRTPSFLPTPALDHAFAGIGAGTVAVCCMHPLDLLKVKFQVSTTSTPSFTFPTSGVSGAETSPKFGVGKKIYYALREIKIQDGWRGLYRGIGPNIVGNASSWGLYFLFYNMLKKHVTSSDDPLEQQRQMSPGSYLLCSAEASAVTAILTNPIWVVKVRMFTTRPDSPMAYRSLRHGLSTMYRTEGIRGLFLGTTLGLVGVGNGAVQFMVYEEMKKWAFERRRRLGKPTDKLSNIAYTFMSGASKLVALAVTYPYQVIRSRFQNSATRHLYPTIPATINRTWSEESFRGFYRGLGTNLVRVLPGTCVTFVVYENLAWLLKRSAIRRDASSPYRGNG